MPASLTDMANAIVNGPTVNSVALKWRDGFPDGALDTTKWTPSVGTGGSIAVASGVLTLNSGTVANDTTSILSTAMFEPPFKLAIGMTLSQRIANQTFYVEFVSVDPVTGTPDGKNSVGWVFDGTTATTAKYRAQVSGNTAVDSAASTIPTTASGGVYEVEVFSDEVWYHGGTLNSATTRANSYRQQVGSPDPNALYKLRLRWLNGATPPASTTAVAVQYLTVQDNEVLTTVVVAGEGQAVAGQALGVAVIGTPAVTISSGTVTTVSTVSAVSAVTSANLGLPGLSVDVASAAITATTTTATLSPTYGCSYEVNIPVTAVSGTNPTLDVVVQESDDSGTNWFDVYHFPRITATGIYRSPKLLLTGNRVRYVQTVGGTAPSFTRSINRLQSSDSANPPIRQLIDRTISLTTLASVTPSLTIQGCNNAQLVVNIGAATTAPTLQLQGSDDNGATWYAVGSALTAVASSTVQVTVPSTQSQLLRAIVTSAGTTVTAGYVLIKGF